MANIPENKYISKKYICEYFFVLAAALTFFIIGMQIGSFSPALVILENDGYYEMPPVSFNEKSWMITCFSIGQVPGAFFASFLNDFAGRKYSIICLILPFITSEIFVYYATNIYMLYISHILRGVSVAWGYSVVPTYISEIASPHLRGLFTVFSILCQQIGNLFGSMVQSVSSINLTAIIFTVLIVLIFPTLCFITETPYFYVTKSKDEDGKTALRKLRRTENVEKEYEEIQTSWMEISEMRDVSWIKIFKVPVNRKLFLVCTGVQIIQQLSGQLPLVSNIHSIVKNSELDLSLMTISIIVHAVGISAIFLSIFVVDSWGRKPLFITVCAGSVFGHTLTATAFYFEGITTKRSSLIGAIEFVGMLIYKAMLGFGLTAMPNILAAELFTTDIKSKCASLLLLVSSLFGVITTQCFDFLYNISGPWAFYSMAFISLLGVIYGFLFVPETKKKSLVEIQNEHKLKNPIKSVSA